MIVEVKHLPDDDPDTSYLEQEGWEDRRKEYESGAFGFIGIQAEARIIRTNGVQIILKSMGLWGIEDDADPSYLKQVGQEEVNQLANSIVQLNYPWQEFADAVERAGYIPPQP